MWLELTRWSSRRLMEQGQNSWCSVPVARRSRSTASEGETGLGYLGWPMMRTNPFCVKAQDAQPCWISPEIHSWAL